MRVQRRTLLSRIRAAVLERVHVVMLVARRRISDIVGFDLRCTPTMELNPVGTGWDVLKVAEPADAKAAFPEAPGLGAKISKTGGPVPARKIRAARLTVVSGRIELRDQLSGTLRR